MIISPIAASEISRIAPPPMLFGPSEKFALIFAISTTAFVALMWRRKYAAPAIALAAYVPALAVACFSTQFDLAGWHGFMHASPIYQMMERGTAPPCRRGRVAVVMAGPPGCGRTGGGPPDSPRRPGSKSPTTEARQMYRRAPDHAA